MKLLTGDRSLAIAERISEIPFNTLFASAVLKSQVQGKIYANDPEDPDTCYIAHPYGMSLLIGNTEHDEFNSRLREYLLDYRGLRNKKEWLQVYPASWNDKISELVDSRVIDRSEWPSEGENSDTESHAEASSRSHLIRWGRFNFEFHEPRGSGNMEIGGRYNITRIDAQTYDLISGSVIPRNFWKHKEDFLSQGIGFIITRDHGFVAASFSAFIEGNVLELGVETCAKYRDQGFGKVACTALIAYCLENDYEPVWACSNANAASYNLAKSLGFEECLSIPYYELVSK